MARKLRKRISRKMTAEERERHTRIREQIEKEMPELTALGREAKREHDARAAKLRDAVAALKNAREELGLSLADIRERTGIERSTLSRLENSEDGNPTIGTLDRYASAVGKEILIVLANRAGES